MRKLVFIGLLGCVLCGCLSATVTGAQLVYDSYTINKQLTNHKISLTANQALYRKREIFNDSRIVVVSFNYDTLILGQATSASKRQLAIKIIQSIPGIKVLYNELKIAKPISLAQQAKDSLITTLVKSKLIAHSSVNPKAFKVVTENNVVYLMGHVEPKQARIATTIASKTTGVKRVIKALRYQSLST